MHAHRSNQVRKVHGGFNKVREQMNRFSGLRDTPQIYWWFRSKTVPSISHIKNRGFVLVWRAFKVLRTIKVRCPNKALNLTRNPLLL